MNTIEFSLRGIARRRDYDDYCKIEYQNNKYLITNGDEDLYDTESYRDAVSMMAGSIYLPNKLGNDLYKIVAEFIFHTHCNMIYGVAPYGLPKSNWHACVVHEPQFLKKGKCFLYKKECLEILKNAVEAQKFTYYSLPEWWDEYFTK